MAQTVGGDYYAYKTTPFIGDTIGEFSYNWQNPVVWKFNYLQEEPREVSNDENIAIMKLVMDKNRSRWQQSSIGSCSVGDTIMIFEEDAVSLSKGMWIIDKYLVLNIYENGISLQRIPIGTHWTDL